MVAWNVLLFIISISLFQRGFLLTTAIVPMKANNQRLPGKNTISLGDKPLCYWLLGTLLKCTTIDRVVVDVWGEEIVTCVQEMSGADSIEISPRPLEYCSAMAGGNFLLERFVDDKKEIYIQCHVTSPFLLPETLDAAIKTIIRKECDACFGATLLQQRLWMESAAPDCLRAVNHNPKEPLARTQDLPPVYMENGSFFAFTGDYYMANGKRRNGPTARPIVLSASETIDIDEPEDLASARSLLSAGLISLD